MARVQFAETVIAPIGVNGAMMPIPGIATTPKVVNPDGTEGAQAPAYAGRTGLTLASLITDSSGTVSYWFDPGDYNIHFDDQQIPPRITSFIRGISSVNGSLGGITTAQLPPGFGTNLNPDYFNETTVNSKAGFNSALTTRRGSVIIPGSESVSSLTPAYMPTPDFVQNIKLESSGLIIIRYQATWKESVNGSGRAGLFIGANQVKIADSSLPSPDTVDALLGEGSANVPQPLASYWGGILSLQTIIGWPPVPYLGDVTTGQAIGGGRILNAATLTQGIDALVGGPCEVFAAAGVYDVGVKFWATSGSVTALNRRLYVESRAF